MIVVSATAVFNLHFQLFPIQILFINLITDVLPALALGVTMGNPDIMKRDPIRAEEPIINSQRWLSIGFYALIISATSIGAVFLSHILLHNTETWNPELCNNILFFTLIFSQLFHVFNMGQSGTNFFKSEVFRNKYVWAAIACCLLILLGAYLIAPLRNVLSILPMSLYDLLISIGAAAVGTLIIQIAKTIKIIGK